MTMTDPIADMLTRIRNGIQVRRKFVDVPSSRIKSGLALVLKEEGYLKDVEAVTGDDQRVRLRLHFKYDPDGVCAITELARVSKPGGRIFARVKAVPPIRRGLGITVLSTSKGVVSNRKAAQLGVGGEILCSVF